MSIAGGADGSGGFREREQADYGPSKGGAGFGGGGGGIGGTDIGGGRSSGGGTDTTQGLPGGVFAGVATSPTYDPYKTASTGAVGQLTQKALDVGRTTGAWNAPTQQQVAGALSWDVGMNLGYDPYALNPPAVTPLTVLQGLTAFLSGPIGMFRTAALGGLGTITGQGVAADISRGASQAGSGNRADFGTQPGFPSGVTGSFSGGTGGGTYASPGIAPGQRNFIGGVVSPRNASDLSGFPAGDVIATARKPFPWWLLILLAAGVGGYFLYQYYKKKRTHA